MVDLVKKALNAKRESKQIEFKQCFDPNVPGEWCELIKDIVSIANSGGGIIVFGLGSTGLPTGQPVDSITSIDPADITNKLSKYTGPIVPEFEIQALKKKGHNLTAFVIQTVSIPIVFQKPGTYDIGGGKQKTAFGIGTVYFRHGAKSEPGNSEDIRHVIERQLEQIRKSWIKGVRKVVQAPSGSQIVTIQPTGPRNANHYLSDKVRSVNDPNAIPVRLTRDKSIATGSFVHEEISDAIFDEINNVVDANRILSKGKEEFLLGQPVYYRIYAERQYVQQSEGTIFLLLKNGLADFYAPSLFWALALPEKFLVQMLTNLYLYPTNRHVYHLSRIGMLLGYDFCQWLQKKWDDKWKNCTQPPSFYWTFKKMISQMKKIDHRLLASRISLTTRISIQGGTTMIARDILEDSKVAASMLSDACMHVFQGDNTYRPIARNLDYLTYGTAIQKRATKLTKSVIKTVGDRKAGDVIELEDVE